MWTSEYDAKLPAVVGTLAAAVLFMVFLTGGLVSWDNALDPRVRLRSNIKVG